jgi:TrkA domain protein
MREGEVLPSPGPDAVLHAGDLLVAVGTQEGLDSAAEILRHG